MSALMFEETRPIAGRGMKEFLEYAIHRERAIREMPGAGFSSALGPFGPFEKQWLVERAPDKVQRLLRKAREHPEIVNVTSPFTAPEGQPSGAPSSFTPITSTSETNMWVPAIWTPIPANSMMAGKLYRVEFGGIFGTSSSAPTFLVTGRVGQSATPSSNITIGASTAVTMTVSLSSVPFYGVMLVIIRALGLAASGASGTGNGFMTVCATTTTAAQVLSFGATVASTIDNTAATGLIVSGTYGTSQASNTMTVQMQSPVISYN